MKPYTFASSPSFSTAQTSETPSASSPASVATRSMTRALANVIHESHTATDYRTMRQVCKCAKPQCKYFDSMHFEQRNDDSERCNRRWYPECEIADKGNDNHNASDEKTKVEDEPCSGSSSRTKNQMNINDNIINDNKTSEADDRDNVLHLRSVEQWRNARALSRLRRMRFYEQPRLTAFRRNGVHMIRYTPKRYLPSIAHN